MKKMTLASIVSLCMLMGCQKAESPKGETPPEPEVATFSPTSRQCASMDVLAEQIAADPARGKRLAEIEQFTARTIAAGTARLEGTTWIIPVVVHVIYKTPQENISDLQVASQITVLNEDFQMTNADQENVPAHFAGVKGKMDIKFELAKIIRKATNKKSWGTNDAMKKSSLGGSDPENPTTMLNMWSCNLGQGLLGYAQFPGGSPATDGIVVLYSAFGSAAKAAGTYTSNYNLGRTATHEVGHWLNLRHIWGDATCGTDFVEDTPQHNTSNTGCPSVTSRSTCTGTPLEMWMNYMDYTYDKCMYMFTVDQAARARAVFATNGPRAAFHQ